MTIDPAAVALRRFGLGARPGDMRRIAGDPRGYVLGQLANPAAALLAHPDLEPSHVVLAEFQEARREKRLERAQTKQVAVASGQASGGTGAANADAGSAAMAAAPTAAVPAADPANRPGQIRREAFREESAHRIGRALSAEDGLLERLVMFWSNHFSVSAAKGAVRVLVGGFEREAIRPHVLGRFADMLLAVEQHPAMLIYLDNQVSTGPASRAGRNRGKGLNENLAREILELHTLGVDGGYTQADVTALAQILTGWTVGQPGQPNAEAGRFFFAPARHEPGERVLLAKRYEDRGVATGTAAIADLARHPATARYIARRLARHFVSEKPPADLVAAMEARFRESGGNLAEVSRVLVTHPACWSEPARKVTPPTDFLVALARASAVRVPPAEIVRTSGLLGQPFWQPPSPKGWPDEDDAWLAPAAVRERLRVAERLARQIPAGLDPRALADDVIGPGLSARTREAVARAETREQGFEILMMSPEMVRR